MAVAAVSAGRESTEAAALPGQRLPDLDPVAPFDLGTSPAGVGAERRWRLGFGSATENVGSGPLIVDARRSPARRTMIADQVITRRGAGALVRPRVGRLRFVTSPDHRHWHLLGFMRYELRHAGTHALVRPDRKTGFCLGDRYDARRSEPRKPRRAVFRGDCVPDPHALAVREGISVGYGDDYRAQLEGQYIDVTGLAPGRYLLVHRVNADGKLRERRRANNASSLLLAISWPRGTSERPQVERLGTCPGSERCAPR